jgi:hypothetical protein
LTIWGIWTTRETLNPLGPRPYLRVC